MEKLEAWALIGRIAHQVRDWNEPFTMNVLKGALGSAGLPAKDILSTLDALHKLPFDTAHFAHLHENYPAYISRRTSRILYKLYSRALQPEADWTVLEIMQYAHTIKVYGQ